MKILSTKLFYAMYRINKRVILFQDLQGRAIGFMSVQKTNKKKQQKK